MYTDTAENAPVLIPEDVTERIGLPAALQAERIFVHKTANYENYVVVQSDRVVAYTPDIEDEEPLAVLTLNDGERVNDITSVGNTLVISSTKNLYYILFRDRSYVFLGNKVPFPYIDFTAEYDETQTVEVKNETEGANSGYVSVDEMWKWPEEEKFLKDYDKLWFAGMIPQTALWDETEQEEDEIYPEHTFVGARRLLSDVFDAHKEKCNEYGKKGQVVNPIVVRYAVDLYGSKTSSIPILVGMNDFSGNNYIKVNCTAEIPDGANIKVENKAELKYTPYKIHAKFAADQGINWADWKDIITNVNIYVSEILPYDSFSPTSSLLNRQYSEEIYDNVIGDPAAEGFVSKKISSATVRLDECEQYKDDLLFASSQTFLVKQVEVFKENGDITEGFNSLINGTHLDLSKFYGKEKEDVSGGETEEETDSVNEKETLQTKDRLYNDDMKHYLNMSKKLTSYNNQVILVQPSQLIDYDYDRLNAYDLAYNIPYKDSKVTSLYEVTYLLRTHTEDKVIKKSFTYLQNYKTTESIYAFQVFPDSRAFKMLVKVTIVTEKTDDRTGQLISTTETKYGEFDMFAHPYLDCAYYYGGMGRKLVSLCDKTSIADYAVNRMDDLENKLFISELNDPFSFPLSHRYTYQSKVVGVAVASTALSQGQFGQFPLYVFTEDGIWAMETAADGSFVTSKPLSREVCINPDSITSIDNAVVFVTSKGVMMIQGSQVMNISAYMNGRHYVPNESAKSLISKQSGYSEYESAISDETPFTEFMRDAKVAYDYNGQRLIFISPENRGFQYVYKIDTQTWHKMAFEGFDLKSPINAYPECLIKGSYYDDIVRQSARVLGLTEEDLQVSLRLHDGNVYIRTDNLDEIDRINDALYAVDKDWTYNTSEDAYEYTIAITGLKDKAVPRWVQDVLGLSNFKFQRLLDGKAFGNYSLLASKEEDDDGSLITDDKYGLAAFFYLAIVKKELCYKIGFTNISIDRGSSRVYSLSTRLDISAVKDSDVAKGILITRPFDLGMPDVFKSITEIKIRGYYDKGNIKYILQGSDNGKDFYTMNSLRGKSWKMFRLFILADLEPTERVSWIDIDFEPRYNNRLR